MAVESNSHRWITRFPNDWKLVHLEDICRIRRGASPRPVGAPKYFGGLIPWIKIADATAEQGRWLSSTKEFVTEAGRDQSVFLKRGSLILSNSGTTGKPKFLAIDGCIHDGWLAFDEFSYISPLFLFYLLISHTDYLTHIADGSVQKNLNTGILKRLQVALPPLEEQQAIAHILGTLDDKIELNQQMIPESRGDRSGNLQVLVRRLRSCSRQDGGTTASRYGRCNCCPFP
jgi:type I restriction enzyme S subunit